MCQPSRAEHHEEVRGDASPACIASASPGRWSAFQLKAAGSLSPTIDQTGEQTLYVLGW